MFRESNPDGGEVFPVTQIGLENHQVSCTKNTQLFGGVKQQERGAEHLPDLVPGFEWFGSIPPPPLFV
jgi:hypothetical protein